jgi:hypothetical protein
MAKAYPIASRTNKSFEFTGAQSGAAIWTPADGHFAVLTELLVTVTEPAVVTVFRGDTDEPSKRILHGYLPVGIDRVFADPIELGENEVLRITTSAGDCRGACGGFELPYRG